MKVEYEKFGLKFEWDDAKASANLAKHGISFEEAAGAFFDPFGIRQEDEHHSWEEDRIYLLAASLEDDILLVCHCYRKGQTIRIFSAREAKQAERKYYETRAAGERIWRSL